MSDFPYSNQQIAEAFGCSQSNIREHKSKHSDNLKRNVDYVSLPDSKYKIFWSKSGVIKLADYIGTDQAKLFIAQFIEQKIEKPLKEITPVTNQTQPSQLDFLQGLLDVLKSVDQRLARVENRIEQVEKRPTTVYLETKNLNQYKTFRKEQLMEKYRRPLNDLIHLKFSDVSPENRWRMAKKIYKVQTGWDFPHVDNASEEQLTRFLGWLENNR